MLLAPSPANLPRYVRNTTSASGVLHVPRNLTVSLCGWGWGLSPAACPVWYEILDQDVTLCSKCQKLTKVIEGGCAPV
eukprot:1163988-Amphidinium_carterae.1